MHKTFCQWARGGKRDLIAVVLLAAAAGARAQDNPTPSNPNPKITPPQETVVVTGTFEATPETEMDRSVSVLELNRAELYKSWVDALPYDPSLDLRQRA